MSLMHVPLVPKTTLQSERVAAAAESYFHSRTDVIKDRDDSDEALKYHLLFSTPEALQDAGLENIVDDVALYNAYYWLLVCARRRCAKLGYDPGFDQQAFMILEYATCVIDFTIVKEVSRLAEIDALER